LLDPNLKDILNPQKEKTIVVFDEAHNIDDICIEAYTVKLNKGILQMAS
jgi:DNA excision repair protein ERCC-2